MKKPSKILYFGKKALAFLLSVLVLSLAVFYVSRLAPGDPLVSYYGDRAEKLTPQERAQAEEKLGLGTLAYESARYKDYNLLMLLSLLSGALVILCSIIAQTINEQIDPRIRAEQAVRETEVQP